MREGHPFFCCAGWREDLLSFGDDRRAYEFLAVLAHELRNPLAAISGSIVLLDRPDAAAQLPWIREVLRRQTAYAVRLIDDLLDVSRIIEGKFKIQLAPADLAEIVHRAVEDVRDLIDERRHRLEVRVAREPMRLMADAMRLEQILVNLLTNAAKYTDPGGRIELTAGCEGAEYAVRVRDSGIGIKADMLPRLFDLFAQGDGSHLRARGGLGIGLALVKRLAELHGGTITAASDGPGQGSQFVLRLPADQRIEPPAPAPAQPHVRRTRPLRVLVVDDNEDAARTLSIILEQSGCEVRTAFSGRQALEAAPQWRPEAALLDLALPDVDGCELGSRLRAIPGLEHVALVAVSGYGQEADRLRTSELGFGLHLLKPVDVPALMGFLAEVSAEGTAASDPPPGPPPPAGKRTYRILVIDDSRLIARLTDATLSAERHEVITAADGPHGIEEARRAKPDVVLCDLRLTDAMDGFAVARALRSDPTTRAVRLFAVSGYDSPEHVALARDAGFDDLLPKPLDPARLSRLLAAERS
jgi:CheY-like chemotaxis protein/two-component sensor histidine kinase